MSGRKRFGPTHFALVLYGGLALSLLGVPRLMGKSSTPRGPIQGVVVDEHGQAIPGASVHLFADDRLRLIETTASDEAGRFTFQFSLAPFHVYVEPPAGGAYAATWRLSADRPWAPVECVLSSGRALEVRVADATGAPVAGAEVRVYERRDEAAVVAQATTDQDGAAELVAPARADIAVFAPGTRLARWRFDAEVPADGARFDFLLPAAERAAGRVTGAAGPLSGAVILSWEEGDAGGWNGFTTADADGRFELPLTERATLVRVLDPQGRALPAERRLAPGERALDFELASGTTLALTTRRAGRPLPSRVWTWASDLQLWSWGTLTDSQGRASLCVAPRFDLSAEPLDPAFEAIELSPLEAGPGALVLDSADG